jgi:hypothetical protein
MRDTIEVGSILIEGATFVPGCRLPAGEPCFDGWVSVGKGERSGLEASLHKAGWTFFYLAGEIEASACGFDREKAARQAVKRLIASLKAQRLNCLEITRVTPRSFLGVPYVTVTGHARHLQESLVLSPIGRRRTKIVEPPSFADERVAAWEDEGGAAGKRAEPSHDKSETTEVAA